MVVEWIDGRQVQIGRLFTASGRRCIPCKSRPTFLLRPATVGGSSAAEQQKTLSLKSVNHINGDIFLLFAVCLLTKETATQILNRVVRPKKTIANALFDKRFLSYEDRVFHPCRLFQHTFQGFLYYSLRNIFTFFDKYIFRNCHENIYVLKKIKYIFPIISCSRTGEKKTISSLS